MKAVLKNDISKLGKSDTLVLFIDEDNVKNLSALKIPGAEFIAGSDLSNFKGKSSELYFIKLENKPGVLLCGLGNLKKFSDDGIRNSSSAAVKFCISKKMKKISIMTPEIKDKKSSDILRLIAEGAMLSNYAFNKYKSDNDLEIPLESIDFYTSGKEDLSIVKDMEILAREYHALP